MDEGPEKTMYWGIAMGPPGRLDVGKNVYEGCGTCWWLISPKASVSYHYHQARKRPGLRAGGSSGNDEVKTEM